MLSVEIKVCSVCSGLVWLFPTCKTMCLLVRGDNDINRFFVCRWLSRTPIVKWINKVDV